MTQDLQDLERDIEQSRAKLDLTIDRLQGKMTMSGVVDDMLGTARKGQYAPLFDNVLETIRRNPVPVMVQRPIGLAASDDLASDQDWADEVEDMRIQRAGMATGAPSDLSDTAPLPASDDLFEERPRTTVGTRI